MAINSVFETEPNQQVSQANAIGFTPGVESLVRALGALGATTGDPDFYQVNVLAGQIITARGIRLTSDAGTADTVLSIVDPNGNVVVTNDDTDGFDSYVRHAATLSGTYTVRALGFGATQVDPFVGTSVSGTGIATGNYEVFISTDRQAVAIQVPTGGADAVAGNASTNVLVGGAGVDTISGGAGDDYIEGGTGADTTLNGEAGDDWFVWRTGDGADTANGGDGVDTLQLILTGGVNAVNGGTLQVTGDLGTYSNFEYLGVALRSAATVTFGNLSASGLRSLTGANATSSLVTIGSGGADTVNGGAAAIQVIVAAGGGADVITGGNQNDQLDGQAGNDTIVGGSGNDVIVGGTGDDTMSGGVGNDIYFVDSTNDVINEVAGEGIDTVFYSVQGTFNTYTNVENHVLTAGGSLTGGAGNDSILAQGTAQAILNGGGGRDYVAGGAGNDAITGGLGDDYMLGGAGIDTYFETGLFGVDVIGDFTAGTGGDIIRFDALQNFAQVQSRLFQVDADGDGGVDDAYIIIDAVNTVSLLNVQTSALTAANFTFV